MVSAKVTQIGDKGNCQVEMWAYKGNSTLTKVTTWAFLVQEEEERQPEQILSGCGFAFLPRFLNPPILMYGRVLRRRLLFVCLSVTRSVLM